MSHPLPSVLESDDKQSLNHSIFAFFEWKSSLSECEKARRNTVHHRQEQRHDEKVFCYNFRLFPFRLHNRIGAFTHSQSFLFSFSYFYVLCQYIRKFNWIRLNWKGRGRNENFLFFTLLMRKIFAPWILKFKVIWEKNGISINQLFFPCGENSLTST